MIEPARLIQRELEKNEYLNKITNLDINLVNVLQDNKTALLQDKHHFSLPVNDCPDRVTYPLNQ